MGARLGKRCTSRLVQARVWRCLSRCAARPAALGRAARRSARSRVVALLDAGLRAGYAAPGSGAWWRRRRTGREALGAAPPRAEASRRRVREPRRGRPPCSGREGFPGSDPNRSSRPRAYQRRFRGRPRSGRSFETMAFCGPPTHNRRAQISFYRRVSMSQIPPPPPGQPTPMGGAGDTGSHKNLYTILAWALLPPIGSLIFLFVVHDDPDLQYNAASALVIHGGAFVVWLLLCVLTIIVLPLVLLLHLWYI